MIKIAPSILSADFSKLGDEIKKVEQAGADLIHIDVMDGHFVPNLTIGPNVVAAVRNVTKLPFDVHLMVSNPQDMVLPFIEAGADILTVHAEAAVHLHRIIETIKKGNKGHCQAGVSLNPATSLVWTEDILREVDLILLMSVNPGFGGQSFIPLVLDKIRRLKAQLKACNSNAVIEVDGGINANTAVSVIEAGADILVAGSAIYGAADCAAAIRQLKNAVL